MAKQIMEITDWKQMREKPKVGKVILTFPDGEQMSLKIQGLSQSAIDVINEKYESMKPAEPVTIMRPSKDARPIQVKVTEGPEFEDYQKKIKAIDSLKMAELALAFIVVKPEGTLEEQIKSLSEDLLAGHFIQIIQAGYEVSGFNLDDEKINTAKNS